MSDEQSGRDDATTQNEVPAESRRDNWTLVTAMGTQLRDRPALALPYLLAGLLLAVSATVHEALPVPMADGSYPAQGLLHIEWAVVPAGMAAGRVPLGAYVDLYPGYLAAAIAIGVVRWVAPAVAAASVLRRSAGGGWWPRPRDVGMLVVLQTLVPLAFMPLAAFGTVAGVFGLLAIALLLFVVGRLFLVPALVVREGLGPWTAVRESWDRMPGAMGTAIAAVVALGWLAYLLTGVATLAWVPDVLGDVWTGTALSVWLAGTLHSIAVVALYERV